MFIKGLEMYGKGWKKIAGLIKTRTVVQIRTHAQKYFLKLSKARQQHVENSGGLSLDGKPLGPGRKVMLSVTKHTYLTTALVEGEEEGGCSSRAFENLATVLEL